MTPPSLPRRLPSEDIKASIRQRIAEGGWQPGMKLPSERELVQQFGCARMTVHHALRELEDEGLIERRQGSGSYVAQLHPISNVLQVRDIHEEIAERGHVHVTRVLAVEREKAGTDIAAAMRLRKGSTVYHVRLVHLENGVPIQLEDRHVNPALAPGFMVEARCPDDGVIEAIRHTGGDWVAAVQWHPEFHRAADGVIDDTPLLLDFLAAARATRGTVQEACP